MCLGRTGLRWKLEWETFVLCWMFVDEVVLELLILIADAVG